MRQACAAVSSTNDSGCQGVSSSPLSGTKSRYAGLLIAGTLQLWVRSSYQELLRAGELIEYSEPSTGSLVAGPSLAADQHIGMIEPHIRYDLGTPFVNWHSKKV